MALFTPIVTVLPADYWTNRDGQKPVAIVAHGTGGVDSRDTLQHGDGRGVSIHRLITKAGKIYQMVPDEHGANHAGAPTSSFTLGGKTYSGGQVNKVTLGFELENRQDGRDPYTDAQLSAMGWQIAEWRKTFGPLPILRHADLDPTRRRDPYQLSINEIERWAAKYTNPFPPDPPMTKAYTVKHRYVTQRMEDNGPPYVRELVSGEQLVVDKWYANNRVHLADGSGFVDLNDLSSL